MASLEYYVNKVRTQKELKEILKGSITEEIEAFIENYPSYLKRLINTYGKESTVLGFREFYADTSPSLREIENAIKKYYKKKKSRDS